MRRSGRASGWWLAGAVIVATGVAMGWRANTAKPITRPLPGQPAESTPLRGALETQVDSVLIAFDSLSSALHDANSPRARQFFRTARLHYKRAEVFLELYTPSTTALLNGPPLDDDGDAPPRPLGEPAAFQRVEAALFGEGDSTLASASVKQSLADVAFMRSTLAGFRRQTRLLFIGESDFLDAARLEMARVSTLGINGVDADASGDAVSEQIDALDGMRALTLVASKGEKIAARRDQWAVLNNALHHASDFLRDAADFDQLDRFTFLASYANPVAHAVAATRATSPTPATKLRRAWRTSTASVFDAHAFDAWAYSREDYPEYAEDSEPSLSASRVALGQRLFNDVRLSGPGSLSCASCHAPDRGFSDGHERSVTMPGASRSTIRNVPTLLNAALQPNQFADERAGSLEQQITMVLASPAEMQSSAQAAAARVSSDSSYRAQFQAAWGKRTGATIDKVNDNALLVAIAAYVRSLTSMDSRFDRAVRGDSAALTLEERRGFNLFSGKAKCASCHFAPIFNGTVPPLFASSEPEIINVPSANVTKGARVDADAGRARVDGIAQHQFAFKVPTVRNVALTAPYMHNGVFKTLEQVVDFYNRGGGAGIGIASTQQTLSARPLKLTDDEQHAIVAFLRSLTDSSAMVRDARRVLHASVDVTGR